MINKKVKTCNKDKHDWILRKSVKINKIPGRSVCIIKKNYASVVWPFRCNGKKK